MPTAEGKRVSRPVRRFQNGIWVRDQEYHEDDEELA